MIVMMDGFDWKPDDLTAAAMIRYPWTALGATAIAASRSRFSTGAAAVLMSFNSMDYYFNQSQRDATVIVGFAVQETAGQIIDIGIDYYTDAGTNRQMSFFLSYASTRGIRLFHASSTSVPVMSSASNLLQIGAWHYVEFKLYLHNLAASGYAEARIDGVTVMSGNLRTNNNATTLLWDRIHIGTSISNGVLANEPAVDDFYILNTSGSVNNDFLGDIRIDSYVPVASGTYTQWTGTGATVASGNWSLVDESPAIDTTDYVSTTVSGNIDTYVYRSLPDLASRIYAVQEINYAGKTGSQLRQLLSLIHI